MPSVSWLGFALLSVVIMAPLQTLWSIEYVLMTPMLLQNGASALVGSYAWIPSPLLQIFLVPYFGHVSDACGSRWQFLVAAALLASCLIAIVPFAPALGSLLGDGSDGPRMATISILAVVFPLADAACSITEQFVRIMVTDLGAGDKGLVMQGHGVLSAVAGLGSAMGYGIGAINWSELFHEFDSSGDSGSRRLSSVHASLPHWAKPRASATVLALTGAILLAPGAIIGTVLFLRWKSVQAASTGPPLDVDQPAGPITGASGSSEVRPAASSSPSAAAGQSISSVPAASAPPSAATLSEDSLAAARQAESGRGGRGREGGKGEGGHDVDPQSLMALDEDPSGLCGAIVGLRLGGYPLGSLCLQQVVAWMGLWPLWQYTTTWIGVVVLGGNASAPPSSPAGRLFERGVRLGSLAQALLALMALAAGGLLPALARRVGPVRGYVGLEVLAALLVAGAAAVGVAASASHGGDGQDTPVVYTALAVGLLGLVGVAWASNNSTPFALAAGIASRCSGHGDMPEGADMDRGTRACGSDSGGERREEALPLLRGQVQQKGVHGGGSVNGTVGQSREWASSSRQGAGDAAGEEWAPVPVPAQAVDDPQGGRAAPAKTDPGEKLVGAFTGALYLSQTLPQLVATLVLGPLVHALGGAWGAAMWWAAGSSAAGALLAWFLFDASLLESNSSGS